jgi:B12-binding domain/radical SAM domain protein of rhizo-twelve system
MAALGPLRWPHGTIGRHNHHHHRFPEPQGELGAEVEASRGCPYHCTFCAKDNFRNQYRRRLLPAVLEEIDQLVRAGAGYIYFIDEIFLPWRELLEGVALRGIKIGIQTRIDLWNEEMLSLLAKAGCVSIEAGVESISEAGRAYLDKGCRMSTEQLSERLIFAREKIPFVQANLIAVAGDLPDEIERWREGLQARGVWANKPVPLFPYPGSPEYQRRWGVPDDNAWERAHASYLEYGGEWSDIQDQQPLSLVQLEAASHAK